MAPAHPDRLPKEQGVKRHYKSEHTYIKNFDSRIYRWTDGHTDRHIDRTKGTEGHIEGHIDGQKDKLMDRSTYGWTEGHNSKK